MNRLKFKTNVSRKIPKFAFQCEICKIAKCLQAKNGGRTLANSNELGMTGMKMSISKMPKNNKPLITFNYKIGVI